MRCRIGATTLFACRMSSGALLSVDKKSETIGVLPVSSFCTLGLSISESSTIALTLSRTSLTATSMGFSNSNITVTMLIFFADTDDTNFKPSIANTACSILSVIFVSIVSALAPL